MAQRQAKLNINGISYLITGIDKSTSYKDILCKIAKQNDVFKVNPAKFKAKQKQRIVDGKKTTPKSFAVLPESETSAIKQLKQVKIIYIGKDEKGEKPLRKRDITKNQIDASKVRKRAGDDSDIEVYHQSRRRMKDFMKMKSKNEPRQQGYNRYGKNRVKFIKTNKQSNQNKGLIEECDKISIYCLNEKLAKEKEQTVNSWQSRNGSSRVGLRSDASSECNSIEKSPSVKLPTLNCKYVDDKDSGIPSWESEEISSKDDGKIEERALERKSKFSDLKLYHSEIPHHENAFQVNGTVQGLRLGQSKDRMSKKTIYDKNGNYLNSDILGPMNKMIGTEGIKLERDVTQNSKQFFGECFCKGDENTKENWSVSTEQKKIYEEVELDFEIIKMEHTESFGPNHTRNEGNEGEGFHLVEDENLPGVQQCNDIDYKCSAAFENSKRPRKSKPKINLENRGSFILIEFDDSQVNGTDGNPISGLEHETFMGQDLICNNKSEAPNFDAEHLALAEQCSNSSLQFDEEDSHENEVGRINGGGNTNRKEEDVLVLEEAYIGRPSNEMDHVVQRHLNGIKCTQNLHDEVAVERNKNPTVPKQYNQCAVEKSRLMINKTSKAGGRKTILQDNFVDKIDDNIKKILDSDIRGSHCYYDEKPTRKADPSRADPSKAEPSRTDNINSVEEHYRIQQKEVAESGNTTDHDVDQDKLTGLRSDMTLDRARIECYGSGLNDRLYRNSVTFVQEEEDKLIVKFANKFARQIEQDFIAKFHNRRSEEDVMLIVQGREEFESTSKVNSINHRKELWKEYVNICQKIYKISCKLFLFDLKAEKNNSDLEKIKELESLHDDQTLDDDEDEIIKEMVEFREYLKKVTLISRKNRLQLRENYAEIEKLDLQLASKRSLLMSFEGPCMHNRSQNIPRGLLRKYHMKKGRSSPI